MTEVLYPESEIGSPVLSPEELEALAGLSYLETALAKISIKNAVLSIIANPETAPDIWSNPPSLGRDFQLTPDTGRLVSTETDEPAAKAIKAIALLPTAPATSSTKTLRKAKPVAPRPLPEQKRRSFSTIPPGPDTEFERYVFPGYKMRETAILEIVKRYKGHPRINELLLSVAAPADKQAPISHDEDSTDYLIKLAARYRLLDRDEVHELYDRIERGLAMYMLHKDKPELPPEAELSCIDLAACYEVINNCNLRLPLKLCLLRYGRADSMLVDFIQDGIIGLGIAARRYDYSRGYTFSTYAYNWIRQSIQRSDYDKRRVIRIPIHVMEKLIDLKSEITKLSVSLGREPTYYECLELTDTPKSDLDEKALLMTYLSPNLASLDQTVGDDDNGATHGDLIAGNSHATEAYELEIKHVIEGVFKHRWLSDDEKVALSLRWGVYSPELDELNLASGITYPDAFSIIDESREASQIQRRTGETSNSDICRLMGTSVENVKELLEAAQSKLRATKIGDELEI